MMALATKFLLLLLQLPFHFYFYYFLIIINNQQIILPGLCTSNKQQSHN